MKREAVLKRIEGKSLDGLRYLKRTNYFTNYKDSCGFNPETLDGHSYRWYALTKQVKGTLLLNTYSYSNQTATHWRKMMCLLNLLGLKYKTLEAPQGLQDLKAAQALHLHNMAAEIVANKYARKPVKGAGKYDREKLKLLEKLGVETSQRAIKAALKHAELARKNRLARAREKAAKQRALKAIEIIIDAENKRAADVGLHVVSPYGLSRWEEERVRSEALEKGFNRVFVHAKQPSHLTLVQGA